MKRAKKKKKRLGSAQERKWEKNEKVSLQRKWKMEKWEKTEIFFEVGGEKRKLEIDLKKKKWVEKWEKNEKISLQRKRKVEKGERMIFFEVRESEKEN